MAAILGVAAAEAQASNGLAARKMACLMNLRKLTQGWQIYADDHGGRFVHNLQGSDAVRGAGGASRAPWASGWQTWGLEPDNTNRALLFETRYARLSPYLNGSANIFKCPSDRYLSARQSSRGWSERLRTYSMNLTLGHANFAANPGPFDPIYAIALKTNDLNWPGPSETTVFLEEHPDSMNDPVLFPPQRNAWVDMPGSLHEGAGGVAFADGRAEAHQWKGSIRNSPVKTTSFSGIRPFPNDPDLSWLSYHSARKSAQSY